MSWWYGSGKDLSSSDCTWEYLQTSTAGCPLGACPTKPDICVPGTDLLAGLCWLCFVHQWCQCLMDQLSTYCLPLLSPSTSATHPLYIVLTGSHKCLSDFQLSHPAAVTDAEFTGIDVLAYCLCSVRILLYRLAYTALAYTNTLLWQFFGLNKIRIEYLLQPYEVLYNESQFLSRDARQSAVLLWQSCLSVRPWRWGTLIT